MAFFTSLLQWFTGYETCLWFSFMYSQSYRLFFSKTAEITIVGLQVRMSPFSCTKVYLIMNTV